MEKQQSSVPQPSIDEWWDHFEKDLRGEAKFVTLIAGLCLAAMIVIGLSRLI